MSRMGFEGSGTTSIVCSTGCESSPGNSGVLSGSLSVISGASVSTSTIIHVVITGISGSGLEKIFKTSKVSCRP